MMNKAEKIAEQLREMAERYQYLEDLLGQAYDVETLWDDLRTEFGDRCGWVSEEANKMVQVIESEMAKIREALDE